MSLYRAEKVGPSPPLGVAMLFLSKQRQGSPNEPRLHSALASRGDHCVNARPIPGARPRGLAARASVVWLRCPKLFQTILSNRYASSHLATFFGPITLEGAMWRPLVLPLILMVEVARIELASASPTSMVLHA